MGPKRQIQSPPEKAYQNPPRIQFWLNRPISPVRGGLGNPTLSTRVTIKFFIMKHCTSAADPISVRKWELEVDQMRKRAIDVGNWMMSSESSIQQRNLMGADAEI